MSCRVANLILVFLLALAAMAAPASAQWIKDGVPVTSGIDVFNYVSVTDGSGGAILVWADFRDSDLTLFAQRIDVNGYIRWTVNGDSICSLESTQYHPAAVADEEGGVVITFIREYFVEGEEKFHSYITAQRLDSNGTRLWGDDGTTVRYDSTDVGLPVITLIPDGSTIIAWSDERNLVDKDIYAQRLDTAGTVLWAANGLPVCTASGLQYDTQVITTDDGNALIGWTDYRNSENDIYAQMIDYNTGNSLWTADGVAVCAYSSSEQLHPVMTTDGYGGAIFAWEDSRYFFTFIFAQRINDNGVLEWDPDGVVLTPTLISGTAHAKPAIAADGDLGAIVAFEFSTSSGTNILAQRIDETGTLLWGDDGLAVCDEPGDQRTPAISSRTGRGAVIAWTDSRADIQDIFAQIVDNSGNLLLVETGGAVSTMSGYQSNPIVVSDGTGGGIVTWCDGSDIDLYAQRITGTQGWYTTDPEILAVDDIDPDEGGWVRIRLGASIYDDLDASAVATSYNVWRKITGASPLLLEDETASSTGHGPSGTDLRLVPGEIATGTRVSSIEAATLGLPPGEWESLGMHPAMQESTYNFAVPTGADSTAAGIPWETYAVSVHTSSPGFYIYSEPDSGYSVDNLAPGSPLGLAAEQSYAPEGLQLTWGVGEEGDLWHYAVYRGTSIDFIPVAGNRIGQPTDPEMFDDSWTWDASYWYKVTAVDRHGNESAFALAGPGGVTGDDPMPLPDATFLSQNFPNPFNPATTIAFGLKSGGHVSLRIYDATVRVVTTLIDESRSAGSYTAEWNGRGAGGSTVASGVYFYKLNTGEFKETKKMILLR